MVPQDDQYKQYVTYLSGIFEAAELEIIQKITDRIAAGVDSDDLQWAADKYAEVQALHAEVRKILDGSMTATKTYFLNGLKDAYSSGYGSTGEDTPFQRMSNRSAVQALATEFINKIGSLYLTILRSSDDAYRKVIGDTTATATVGGDRRRAAGRALVRFADEGITGFVDKRGRQWGIAEYTEMATRTTYTRAYAEGNVNRYVDEGYDLVYVPTSPEPCPTCDPLENKVYSAGGLDSNYPSLRDAISKGLFHPNCTHRVVPYIKGLTKIAERAPKAERSANYEERQQQRAIERDIRKYKRREVAAITPEEKARATAGVKRNQQKMREFIKDTDRLRDSRRENLGTKPPIKPKNA